MLRRLFSGIGQAWQVAGLSLLLLILVDRGLAALLPDPGAWAPMDPAAVAPDRTLAAAVADDPWTDDYWREHRAAKDTGWRSWVYWRRGPHAGDIINVDAHGFRATPATTTTPRGEIWIFGGSLVWGTGNRDQGTLPAQIEHLLAEQAPELGLRVLNFGESGYVSRQSLAAFDSALRCSGPKPAMAVFVDGANDVYAALQAGRAGLPQNEANRVLEFDSGRDALAALRALATRFDGIARLAATPLPEPDAATLSALAEAVAADYLVTVRHARALAAAHGVPALHVWQPTVMDRAEARADEAAIVGSSARRHVLLQRATRAAVARAASGDAAMIDAGDVYDAVAEPVYFDFVHVSERGQRLLAERIVDAVRERLAAPAGELSDAAAPCLERPAATSRTGALIAP
jgi:lysophospholipase L1-like esterase